MLITGAKGFAKEVLEVLHQNNEASDVYFFDDVSENVSDKLYGKFKVIRSLQEAKAIISLDNRFCLGIGNPMLRYKMKNRLEQISGVLASVISPKAAIGHFGTSIGNGCTIMTGVVITNDVKIGTGVLVNLNCTIGHDSIIEDFVELCPGVHISGNCKVGRFSNIGTNASVLPGISIGENVVVGAGAVVTKDIPANSLVIGIPAAIKEQIPVLSF
jgi:sugar O-acyltransferase (sialic acid O-acetyltransferase NeuD family)